MEAGHNKSAAVSPLSACLRNPPDNMETPSSKNREGCSSARMEKSMRPNTFSISFRHAYGVWLRRQREILEERNRTMATAARPVDEYQKAQCVTSTLLSCDCVHCGYGCTRLASSLHSSTNAAFLIFAVAKAMLPCAQGVPPQARRVTRPGVCGRSLKIISRLWRSL